MTEQILDPQRESAPDLHPLPDHPDRTTLSAQMRRRVVISSTIGNALEWFDFSVFGLFAGVIGRLFFPAESSSASLLLTFATFGLAFAARPIGGLVFGLWADRHGRKAALVAMIMLMAAGTGMVGILPTYDAIGIAAPIALVLARFIQGFSAGGEFGNASAMLIEFAPPNKRGLYGSFQIVSQSIAFTLAAAAATALTAGLSAEHFASWGWRVPFILGILIGPVGWYLRRRVDESPEFRAYRAARAATAQPVKDVTLKKLFADHPRELILSFCLMAAVTAINYVMTIYLPTFAANELQLRLLDAQLGLLVGTLVTPFIVLFFAGLSDRIGRRAVIVPALVLFSIAYCMMMQRLVAAPSTVRLWELQATGLILAALAGPIPAFMTEIFPVAVRSTGVSLMYNLAVMLFGGLAPFINTWLVEVTGQKTAPVYYVLAAAVVGLIGMAIYRRKAQPRLSVVTV